MQQGSNAGGAATLTDEQILGMDEGLESGGTDGTSGADQGAGRSGGSAAAQGGAEQLELGYDDLLAPQTNGANGAAPATGARPNDAATSAGEGEPAWLATLDSQPAAAAEARRWRDAAKDVSALDAAYFSAEPGARSGLAERLYQSDPAAFRSMLAESARTLAVRDPQGLAELARQLSLPDAVAALRPARSLAQAAQPASESAAGAQETAPASNRVNGQVNGQAGVQQSGPSNSGAAFPAEAYRTFESTTNEDVGRRMHEAIDRTLTSTLPQGVAEGARRRIGEDIFREVHASLASDRELSRRVGETLKDWRFDAAARQQVVAMVSGRARAVLPEVARRVVAEWTSSVLASDRAKTARVDAAAARRDITGGRLPEPMSSSTLRPREVDYQRLSDEQILEM